MSEAKPKGTWWPFSAHFDPTKVGTLLAFYTVALVVIGAVVVGLTGLVPAEDRTCFAYIVLVVLGLLVALVTFMAVKYGSLLVELRSDMRAVREQSEEIRQTLDHLVRGLPTDVRNKMTRKRTKRSGSESEQEP